VEALDSAKKSVKLVHQLFKDLIALCGAYIKKIEAREAHLRPKRHGASQQEAVSDRQQISILSTSPSQFQVP